MLSLENSSDQPSSSGTPSTQDTCNVGAFGLAPMAERDGYVPNVVYTCGALLRGRELLLPFAVAYSYARFAVVEIDALLARMTSAAGAA